MNLLIKRKHFALKKEAFCQSQVSFHFVQIRLLISFVAVGEVPVWAVSAPQGIGVCRRWARTQPWRTSLGAFRAHSRGSHHPWHASRGSSPWGMGAGRSCTQQACQGKVNDSLEKVSQEENVTNLKVLLGSNFEGLKSFQVGSWNLLFQGLLWADVDLLTADADSIDLLLNLDLQIQKSSDFEIDNFNA